jgi:hypothetical protein
VCSAPDPGAAPLYARISALVRAIDELAADSRDGLAAGEASARVAGIWVLLEGLDPDLDRCRERYDRQPGT